MIQAIEVENFKCFKERQVFHCGPITLIYGPNSAGKSTGWQALRILHEQISKIKASGKKQWVSPSLCAYAMDDLGGGSFARLVHGHDPDGQIKIAIRWSVTEAQKQYLPNGCDSASAFCEFMFKKGVMHSVRLGYGDNDERFCFDMADNNGAKGWRGYLRARWYMSPAVQKLHETMGVLLKTVPSLTAFIDGLNQKSSAGLIAVRNIATSWCILSDKRIEKRWRGVVVRPGMLNNLGDYRSLVRSMINGELRMFRRELHSLLDSCVFIGPQRIQQRKMVNTSLGEKNRRDSSNMGLDDNTATLLGNSPKVLAEVNRWLTNLEIKYEIIVEEDITESGNKNEIKLKDVAWDCRIAHSLNGVGFGIGQLLPIIVQSVSSRDQVIVIDEPEVHIHPRLQSALGDLFIESATKRGNRFIIETHSENLVLRLLRRVREESQSSLAANQLGVSQKDVSVMYVDSSRCPSVTKRLRIDSTGEFADAWPQGFFEERAQELF